MIKLSVLVLFLASIILFAHALPQYDTPSDTPSDTPADTPTATDTSVATVTPAAATDSTTTPPAASATSSPSGKVGNKITLDSTTLCIYLPPSPGGDVAGHEDDAQPFCNTTANPLSPDVKVIPTGFIVTSHFSSGDGFVQYTGKIDPAAYKLNPKDQGGQYDSVGAPPGAKCVGTIGGKEIVKFVNLIEPADKNFCVRCCTESSKCNTGISTAGCVKVIPGDYS